jgi:chemotaxis protein methyltransferase CheR
MEEGMASSTINSISLTEAQFDQVSDLVRKLCGINLHVGKKELVKARLNKRLRKLGLRCFSQYLDYIRQDTTGVELTMMLDCISTNLTSFFREADHFEYLGGELLAKLAGRGQRRLRVWSAGCSSGEEPYSLAILLNEKIPDIQRWDVRILATDLSTRALDTALQGEYGADRLKTVPANVRGKYFVAEGRGREKTFRANNRLRDLITFGRLNLMESWPMKGPFDVIFCRNVMIYFDKSTQGELVNRYFDLLGSGGTLFIGHSESLTGVKHRFRYVRPTVYEKP